LVYALLASKEHQFTKMIHPLVNIPRWQFPLRKDTQWLFTQVGIDEKTVQFLDDIDLNSVPHLQLVLVDHNHPSAAQMKYIPKVVAVVDHHEDAHLFDPTKVNEDIRMVGSCSTLIVDHVFQAGWSLDNHLSLLMFSAIVIDTFNFDGTKKIFTSRC